MNTSSAASSSNSGGLLDAITGAFSKITGSNNKSKGNINSKNTSTNNLSKPASVAAPAPVKPASAGFSFEAKGGMRGGAAPVEFSYGPRMQQPSNAVMQWATTADAPTPSGPQMRNVAHGGKRRTSKRRTHHKRRTHRRKSTRGGRRHIKQSRSHRTMKRKTRRSRHGKKRN